MWTEATTNHNKYDIIWASANDNIYKRPETGQRYDVTGSLTGAPIEPSARQRPDGHTPMTLKNAFIQSNGTLLGGQTLLSTLHMFADDVKLHSKTEEDKQAVLQIATNWATDKGMS